VLYISHRLNEVMRICDRVTVMRNGMVAGTQATSSLNRDRLVEMMIGQSLDGMYHHETRAVAAGQQPLLAVRGLSVAGVLHDLSFDIYPGQVFAIAGQIGSGAAEAVRALAGLVPGARGQLNFKGQPLPLRASPAMRAAGFAFISEDRAAEGLFLKRPIRENLAATSFADFCKGGVLSLRRMHARAAQVAQKVGVDPSRLMQRANVLSGGNQQKLAFGRCLAPQGRHAPALILMNEPTRGVDVGARADIYGIMRELCGQGMGVLMHSTDLEEVLGVADVILTLYRGRLVRVYAREQASLPALAADITHSESRAMLAQSVA
jgi:ribose transport system ATP-binding protein/rhamnose transport system ATP-binding protein